MVAGTNTLVTSRQTNKLKDKMTLGWRPRANRTNNRSNKKGQTMKERLSEDREMTVGRVNKQGFNAIRFMFKRDQNKKKKNFGSGFKHNHRVWISRKVGEWSSVEDSPGNDQVMIKWQQINWTCRTNSTVHFTSIRSIRHELSIYVTFAINTISYLFWGIFFFSNGPGSKSNWLFLDEIDIWRSSMLELATILQCISFLIRWILINSNRLWTNANGELHEFILS